MSRNNQYIEFSDDVVKKYVKTVTHNVAGRRLDPRTKTQVSFVLSTDTVNIAPDTSDALRVVAKVSTFDYDTEVLELYSDTEVRVFERLNRSLIERGLLKEYTSESTPVDRSNMLSDDEVDSVAAVRTLPEFKKRISGMTSEVSLNRIAEAVVANDRPASMKKAVQDRINELRNNKDAG